MSKRLHETLTAGACRAFVELYKMALDDGVLPGLDAAVDRLGTILDTPPPEVRQAIAELVDAGLLAIDEAGQLSFAAR